MDRGTSQISRSCYVFDDKQVSITGEEAAGVNHLAYTKQEDMEKGKLPEYIQR